ncbi:MAG: GGDEF domain-containing protein [Actinomycetota bacterium]|nr:GGDEF domain-containing protein [Actinomycetota bacterium]
MPLLGEIEGLMSVHGERSTPPPVTTAVAPDLAEHRRQEATSMLESLLVLWAVGEAVFLVALVAVPPPGSRLSMLIGIEAAGVLALVLVAEWRHRLPAWTGEACTWFCQLVVGGVVWTYGAQSAPFALFWLWFVVYSSWFLPWHRAAGQVGVVAVVYGLVLAETGGGGTPLGLQWALTVATLVVVCTLVAVVRHRFDALVERLADAAATDRLTGLGNRHTFDEVMEREFERARRANESLTLVLGDLDGFKAVNDRFGHRAGDEVLRRLSAVLTEHCRVFEPPMRLGGDEFAFVLVATDSVVAHHFAERIRMAVRVEFAADALPITISLGLASYPRHSPGLADLFRAADDAVYAAKREGRNCTVVGRPPSPPDAGAAVDVDVPVEAATDRPVALSSTAGQSQSRRRKSR